MTDIESLRSAVIEAARELVNARPGYWPVPALSKSLDALDAATKPRKATPEEVVEALKNVGINGISFRNQSHTGFVYTRSSSEAYLLVRGRK